MRLELLAARECIAQRVAQEADLHFEREARENAMSASPYLTGALTLREQHTKSLWSACAAIAKALVHSDRTDLPKWAEPLRPTHIAVGLARWVFNALCRGLPKLPYSEESQSMRLPTEEEDPSYWAHFRWLHAESERRTKEARFK